MSVCRRSTLKRLYCRQHVGVVVGTGREVEKGLNSLHDACCWNGGEEAGKVLIVDGECDIWR